MHSNRFVRPTTIANGVRLWVCACVGRQLGVGHERLKMLENYAEGKAFWLDLPVFVLMFQDRQYLSVDINLRPKYNLRC